MKFLWFILSCLLSCLTLLSFSFQGHCRQTANSADEVCANVHCSNHGMCTEQNGLPRCQCELGYRQGATVTECVPQGQPQAQPSWGTNQPNYKRQGQNRRQNYDELTEVEVALNANLDSEYRRFKAGSPDGSFALHLYKDARARKQRGAGFLVPGVLFIVGAVVLTGAAFATATPEMTYVAIPIEIIGWGMTIGGGVAIHVGKKVMRKLRPLLPQNREMYASRPMRVAGIAPLLDSQRRLSGLALGLSF